MKAWYIIHLLMLSCDVAKMPPITIKPQVIQLCQVCRLEIENTSVVKIHRLPCGEQLSKNDDPIGNEFVIQA